MKDSVSSLREGPSETSWSSQTSGGHFLVPAPLMQTNTHSPNSGSHDTNQVASGISFPISLLYCCRPPRFLPSFFLFSLFIPCPSVFSLIWCLSLSSSLSGLAPTSQPLLISFCLHLSQFGISISCLSLSPHSSLSVSVQGFDSDKVCL